MVKKHTNILFLYSELAGYVVSSMNFLAAHYPVNLRVIRWPINEEAPFEFEFKDNIQVLVKSTATSNLLGEFEADIVYLSGWMDTQYLQIAKSLKKKGIPILLGIDNPWTGSLKQRIAATISPLYLANYATHIWCPGVRQYEFARRLGFTKENILLGLYSADTTLFKKKKETKRKKNKTLLYAGRFLEWKGVRELYSAFDMLKKEEPTNNWQLLMYGRGPLKEQLTPTASITIKDFIQPKELREELQNVGAFCLPSYEEHWGVIVHEAAAAGCPIIVSDGVGAGTLFVKNEYNGFVFKSKDNQSLKSAIRRMMNCSEEERVIMGQKSINMATQITPELWSATLMSILN